MIQIFETGMMSTARWEAVFNEAISKGPPTPARNVTERRSSPINEDAAGIHTDEDMSLGSVPSSVSYLDTLVGQEEEGAPLMWTSPVDELVDRADWATVAREQRAAMDRLNEQMGALFATVPAVVTKLNARYHPAVSKHSKEIRSLRGDMDDFTLQVGSLLQLAADHGSLSQAVNMALTQSDLAWTTVQGLEEELGAAAD